MKHEGKELTEVGMNGVPEKKLPEEFKKPEYRFLVVANKYQTGFDQPKLCAMYVMKSLSGIAAVQTLSRLNRICKPHDKHTFILDFVNTIEDVKKAFAPYYTTTVLASSVTPSKLYTRSTTRARTSSSTATSRTAISTSCSSTTTPRRNRSSTRSSATSTTR